MTNTVPINCTSNTIAISFGLKLTQNLHAVKIEITFMYQNYCIYLFNYKALHEFMCLKVKYCIHMLAHFVINLNSRSNTHK